MTVHATCHYDAGAWQSLSRIPWTIRTTSVFSMKLASCTFTCTNLLPASYRNRQGFALRMVRQTCILQQKPHRHQDTKLKLSLCTPWSHMQERKYSSTHFFKISALDGMSSKLNIPAALLRAKRPRNPLNRRVSGPQRQSGYFVKVMVSLEHVKKEQTGSSPRAGMDGCGEDKIFCPHRNSKSKPSTFCKIVNLFSMTAIETRFVGYIFRSLVTIPAELPRIR
jgi:hypothetical protein